MSARNREQDLLVDLLKGETEFDNKEFDPEVLMDLLVRHRLIPYVSGDLFISDDSWQRILENRLKVSVQKALNITRELLIFTGMFNEQPINYFVTKGPALSWMLFGDPSKRSYNDLDIHIHPDDFKSVLNELLSTGYQVLYPDMEGDFKFRYYFRYKRDIGLLNPESGVYIELHYGINPRRILPDRLEEEIFKTRTKILVAGKKIPVPLLEYHFIYLCMHGAKHLYFRLFWLKDVANCLTRMEIDHKKVMETCRTNGLGTIMGVTMLLVRRFFGVSIPDHYEPVITGKKVQMLTRICELRIFGPENEHFQSRILKQLYFLNLRPGIRYRIFQISGTLHRWYIRKFMGGK